MPSVGLERTAGSSSDPPLSYSPPALRTIHYLGSKLRLLRPIGDAIAQVAPPRATVCDLFAGSGTVSIYLASAWNVVASDIQEYSRVLCSGLLNPPPTRGERVAMGREVVRCSKAGGMYNTLHWVFSKLIDYERSCAVDAAAGNVDGLCGVMECPPLISEAGVRPSYDALKSPWCLARERLVKVGLDDQVGSVVSRYFGGVYFSWRQAVELDALLDQVHRMHPRWKHYYLACVLAAASDLANTVGKHFAQRARPRKANGTVKGAAIRNALRDRSKDTFSAFIGSIERLNAVQSNGLCHRALRRDFRDLLSDARVHFDVLYADPPYTRDHYSRYYHVLETMARHDSPDVSRTLIRSREGARLSRGVYRSDRHQSPFCIHSKAEAAFRVLADGASKRNVPLVLSYSPYDENAGNRPRVLTVNGLLGILRQYFRVVDVCEIPDVNHSKLNLVERNVSVSGPAELLVVCRP